MCQKDGTPYGKIWMDQAWESTPSREHEFVALSEAKSTEIAHIDLPSAQEAAETKSSGWDAFFVMMIHYPCADERAERMGLGVILQESMNEDRGASWKEIWLH